MKISAVLFDLDGTLTDSTVLFHDAVAHGLSCFDVTMDTEHFNGWHTSHQPWPVLFGLHGKPDIDSEEMEKIVMRKFDDLLATDCRWLPGAEETIRALKERGMPTAIVTNSLDPLIDTMNRSLPLKSLFDIIITATFTKDRRKPDPYGPLVAAERLGVRPEECMFVGDQKFDMMAAIGAGMHECLFAGPHTPPEVELMVKNSVKSLPEILALID